MDLMLVEPDPTGHRIVLYVTAIAREALRRGWCVRLLTVPSAREHTSFRRMSEALPGVETHEMPSVRYPPADGGPLSLVRFQWSVYRAVGAGYRSAAAQAGRPDLVYLNSLDALDKVLAVKGSPLGESPFAGLTLAPRFHHRTEGVRTPRRAVDPLYGALFKRLLAAGSLKAVTTIDPTLPWAVQRRRWPGRGKVHLVPDPGLLRSSEERAEARARLELAADSFVVLLYGGITRRKGLSRLLRSVADLSTGRRFVALLAGQVHDEAAAELSGPVAERLRSEGRLVEVRGFLDQEAEGRVFRAADAVWLGYEGFYGASGVLVQAGAAGLPVVATGEGLIGWLTRRYELGALLEDDAGDASRAIERLAADDALRARYGSNGLALARERTPERFGEAVCDVLARTAAAEDRP